MSIDTRPTFNVSTEGISLNVTSPRGEGGRSVPGQQLRYDRAQNVDLNKYQNGWTQVIEIAEESILYQVLFEVNSANIHFQVEIDGQEIITTADGFLLSDLEDLKLQGSQGNGNNSTKVAPFFPLFQYDANRWIWKPEDPVYFQTSFTVKMKSSNSSNSRDCDDILCIRRSLA
jgi:hypothetical protein